MRISQGDHRWETVIVTPGTVKVDYCRRGECRGGVFPEDEKVSIAAASPLGLLQENNVKIEVTAQNTETLSIRRQVK